MSVSVVLVIQRAMRMSRITYSYYECVC